jgi:hypothetical protein
MFAGMIGLGYVARPPIDDKIQKEVNVINRKHRSASEVDSISRPPERPMNVLHTAGNASPVGVCTHSRMIDTVSTGGMDRTPQVRCLECGAIIDDPTTGRSEGMGAESLLKSANGKRDRLQ